MLFVPGDRPERFAKAAASGADAVILDLEDSVAPSAKAAARDAVAQALLAERPVPIFVRVSPIDTAEFDADMAAVGALSPDGIMLPKAEGAESIRTLVRRLDLAGDRVAMILPVATETPAAVFRLGDYAGVADRLCGLTWGAEDLPAAIGAATSREEDGRYTPPYELVRSLTLFGAHAAGVAAIETVYPDIRDVEGLTAYARRGLRDGFTGMMAIHPAQVPVINDAFTPTAEAVSAARRIVEAFAAAPTAGALQLDGRMVDAPHLTQAKRLLALAGQSV